MAEDPSRFHLTLSSAGRPVQHGWWPLEATARAKFRDWVGLRGGRRPGGARRRGDRRDTGGVAGGGVTRRCRWRGLPWPHPLQAQAKRGFAVAGAPFERGTPGGAATLGGPVSDDLVQFLRARLDEEERITKAAPRGPWRMDVSGSIVDADGGRVILSVGGSLDGRTSRWPEGPAAEVMTTWHPERALREIEAKRQTLRELEQAEFTLGTAGPGTPPHDLMTGAVNTLRRVARHDAAVYVGHPDFDPAWLED